MPVDNFKTTVFGLRGSVYHCARKHECRRVSGVTYSPAMWTARVRFLDGAALDLSWKVSVVERVRNRDASFETRFWDGRSDNDDKGLPLD